MVDPAPLRLLAFDMLPLGGAFSTYSIESSFAL
jgi:hypothetical protein